MKEKNRYGKLMSQAAVFSLVCLAGIVFLAAGALGQETDVPLFARGQDVMSIIITDKAHDNADQSTLPYVSEDSNTVQTSGSVLAPIYITGEVQSPGVFHLPLGAHVFDLIEAAGGFTDNAAMDAINLAAVLQPETHIRVPSLSEWKDSLSIRAQVGNAVDQSASSGSKVNLNTAGQTELETLPGVGPETAKAILRFRDEQGGFDHIEELMLIPGIKEARFQKLADFVTVG